MHSPSPDFTITRLGTPRGGSDWRAMLELAEKPDYPHPALMRQLEGAMADIGPRDLDAPEMLTRLAAVRGLSVTAKERLVRLSMKACAEHVSDKAWNNAMRDIVDTRIGRMMLQKRDSGFVEAYANLVLKTAIGSPVNPTRAVSSLPLAKEAEGIARAELGKRSTNKAIGNILKASWAQEGRDGRRERARMMKAAEISQTGGDPVLAFFRNLGPIGKLLNVAVLTGMLSGMLPATASAGFSKKDTAVAEREADNPAKAGKPRATPVAPAPGDAVAPQAPAPAARERVGIAPAQAAPAGVKAGKGLDKVLKPEVQIQEGDHEVIFKADSGINVPSDPGAASNGKVRLPSVTPSASVSVTSGSIQANFEVMSRLRLSGMDSESAWGMGVALAYIDAMQESGLAIRAVYDNDDGFKDIAARLGLSVGERGQLFVTAGMKQRFVDEVSRLVNIGDPEIRTRLKNFVGTAEYNYKNAEDPTELLQDLFVIATYAHQPGEDLGKIGMYQRDDGDEITEWSVYAQYRGADKFQVEFGTRLQLNSWLAAEVQAGASVTSIQKWFASKAKKIFSPLLGASLEADLDGGWKLVFDARAEKEIASVGLSASYTHAGATGSIGIEVRKEHGTKTVDIRPGVKLKTTTDALGKLLTWGGETQEHATARKKDEKAYRIGFAQILKFPQPHTSESLVVDAHRTFDERAEREIAVKKTWVFEEIEKNPDGSLRSGLVSLGRPIDAVALLSHPEYWEYFEAEGDKLRVYFRGDRGAKDGKPLPPSKIDPATQKPIPYKIALVEKDRQYSVASLVVIAGSSLYEVVPEKVNDIPAELYQSVVAAFVRDATMTIKSVIEAVAEAVALPDISSMAFSEATVSGATLSLAAEHAAGGIAHVAVIRGKKLTNEEIRAISLEAIKSGKLGEYSAVPLDADGKAKISVKSDADGADITVVAIVENAAQKLSEFAEGATVTLPSLAGFASVPKCEAVFNTLTAACSATVTKTDATVHIAYFAEALKDLSDAARVRDAAGAVASVDFATSSMAGAGKVTFKEAGTYYGYAVTVNANGLSRSAVALGTVVIAATREAPSVSSLQCDANAETCAIATDTPGARVSIAIKDSPVTFTATADDQGVAKIDYASKLAPGSYEFVITLKHPTEDRISSTDTRTVRIAENPAPALVGEQTISGVTTTSYQVSGQASEGGDVYVLSIPTSDPDAAKTTVETVLARGKKSTLAQDGTKWVYDVVVDGRSPSTDYVTLTVFRDAKWKLSVVYRKDAKTLPSKPVEYPPEVASAGVDAVTHDGAVLSCAATDANQSEKPSCFYVVLPADADAPTAERIAAGQDADGKPASIRGTATPTGSAVKLEPQTRYVAYFAAKDSTDRYSAVKPFAFTTLSIPILPPTHSLSVSAVTDETVTFALDGKDPQGREVTRFWVVLPKGAKEPSQERIAAGQDADGKPALSHGSTKDKTSMATGLPPETELVAWSYATNGSKASATDSDAFATRKLSLAASVASKTHTSVTLSLTVAADATVRYVVGVKGARTPTAAQVLAGQDADGKPAALSGILDRTNPLISGLEPAKEYEIFTVAEKGGKLSIVDRDSATTDKAPNGPPTHSLKVTTTTAETVTFAFAGEDPEKQPVTFYWAVFPKGAKKPSIEQMAAGTDGDGKPAIARGSTKDKDATATGLPPETEFVAWGYSSDEKDSTDPERKTSAIESVDFITAKVPLAVSVASKTHTTVTVTVDTLAGATVHYLMLARGAALPTPAQIKAGKDASGNPVALSGTLAPDRLTVSGLEPSTKYDLVSVSEKGGKFSAVDRDSVETDEQPNRAPTHSVSIVSVTHDSALAAFANEDLDKKDTVTTWYVLVAAGSGEPNYDQIKAGKDASGNPAVKNGNTVQGTQSLPWLAPETDYDLYSYADDTKARSAIRKTPFSTSQTPNTAPTHSLSATDVTYDSVKLTLTTTDNGTFTNYWVVVTGAEPSYDQIKAGKDASGNPAIKNGSTAGGTANPTGLPSETALRAYSYAEDALGARSPIRSASFTTDAPPNTAPTFSTTVGSVTATTAALAFTSSDDRSTVRHYYVVLPASATAPTITQVLAGQDGTGATASIRGNTLSTTEGLTGLSPNTAYKVYSVGKENDGTLTSALDTDNLTTLHLAVTAAPSSVAISGGSLYTSDTTPTVTAGVPANAVSMQVRVTTVGGTVVSDWSSTDVSIASGTASWTPSTPLAESAGTTNSRYIVTWRGVDGNGTPGPTAALAGAGIDIRTSGPGTLTSWGEAPSTVPTQQSTEYTRIFDAPNWFGWAISDLSCTVPLGGSVSSCTYDADSDKITVVFTTPAQAGFRLTITGKDRYGVAFTKVQNASGLTPLVPTASPTNFEISTASDANGDGRIGTLTPTLSADLPTGATHLQYSVDGGAWVAVTDGATSFTPTLTVGSRTIRVVGANANGRAADSTAASMTLDVRTDGPGTLANWGDGSIAPTQQSTQYTTSFTAPDGFGGSVTNLTVTAPLGGTINSAQYNSTTGKIDVTYTTPAQAGFRLTLSFTDAYEVTKTKTQIVSNLATLVPTASPTGVALTSGTIVDGVAKISTTTPTVTATLPAGATHLRYRVDEGNWTAVADGDTSFSTAALTAGDHTVDVIGANANGQAADSTAVRLNLNLRTTGPGTIGWSTAPTQQSTQYTKELTATNGFGGAVSSLACDAPLGGSVSSCTYDATTDTITATFTTPAQAGFRLRIQGTDAHGVPFSKVINASGLTS